jgi:hypothetical protein
MLLIVWGEKWASPPESVQRMGLSVCRRNVDDLIHKLRPSETVILSEDVKLIEKYPCSVYMPRDSGCLCEALVNTFHLWDDRVVFVGHEVYLTSMEAYRISSDKRPTAFWALEDQVMAVSVYPTEATQLMLAMWAAARDWYDRKGNGGLWEAYWIYRGVEPMAEFVDEWGVLTKWQK